MTVLAAGLAFVLGFATPAAAAAISQRLHLRAVPALGHGHPNPPPRKGGGGHGGHGHG